MVYGTAPKFITTRDESLLEPPSFLTPVLPKQDQEEIKPPVQLIQHAVDPSKLKYNFDPPTLSQYDLKKKEEQRKEEEKKIREETVIDDDTPEPPK